MSLVFVLAVLRPCKDPWMFTYMPAADASFCALYQSAAIIAVTVTTVTCSVPQSKTDGTFQSSHSVPDVSSMKQKTLQFALE